MDDQLATFLKDRDVVCPECGYNLRGLTEKACPECWHELTLGVQLAHPYGRAMVAATIGLSVIGSAFALFLLGITIVNARSGGFFSEPKASCLFLGVPIAVLGIDVFAIAWFTSECGRKWFGCGGGRRRGVIVIGCWAVSVAVFLAWFGAISMAF